MTISTVVPRRIAGLARCIPRRLATSMLDLPASEVTAYLEHWRRVRVDSHAFQLSHNLEATRRLAHCIRPSPSHVMCNTNEFPLACRRVKLAGRAESSTRDDNPAQRRLPDPVMACFVAIGSSNDRAPLINIMRKSLHQMTSFVMPVRESSHVIGAFDSLENTTLRGGGVPHTPDPRTDRCKGLQISQRASAA